MKINGRYVEGKGQHGHTGENVIWGNLGLCDRGGGICQNKDRNKFEKYYIIDIGKKCNKKCYHVDN